MPVIQELLNDLKRIEELHRKKNDDYANPNNPFSNFDCSTYLLSLFSNPRDQSFVWPIATKLARLSTLLNSQKTPNNESVGDSLLDIATYCLLWKADLNNRAGIKEKSEEANLDTRTKIKIKLGHVKNDS